MTKKTICLVVGHKKRSPGAINQSTKLTEFQFNSILVDMVISQIKNTYSKLHKSHISSTNNSIKLEIGSKRIIYDQLDITNEFFKLINDQQSKPKEYKLKIIKHMRSSYSALPRQINKHDPDICISFHSNAYNKKADGCEVLYYHNSTNGKLIADVFQTEIVKALGNSNRGIKPKTSEDRGGYLLRYVKAPCIIIEPFFIDNDKELINALLKYDQLINSICTSIWKSIELL